MPDANGEERQYYLRRIQLLNELLGERVSWGKKQSWLVTFLVSVLAVAVGRGHC